MRQREQILKLILEDESVSSPYMTHSLKPRLPASLVLITCLCVCRSTCLLTSLMSPRRRTVSQEVTSERCVGTLLCSASETLSTRRATGILINVKTQRKLTFHSTHYMSVSLSVHRRTSSVPSISPTSRRRSVR